MKKRVQIHPLALVSAKARIGRGTRVWAFVQIRENARVGRDCTIGNGVYIDKNVRVGDRVDVHNRALLYRNLTVGNDVFIGPGVCFTNDARPRANRIKKLGRVKWEVRRGASVGAHACVLPGVTIGRYAMIGAGSLVTKDVPDHGLVYGSPAKLRGFVSPAGFKLEFLKETGRRVTLVDRRSHFRISLGKDLYAEVQAS